MAIPFLLLLTLNYSIPIHNIFLAGLTCNYSFSCYENDFLTMSLNNFPWELQCNLSGHVLLNLMFCWKLYHLSFIMCVFWLWTLYEKLKVFMMN